MIGNADAFRKRIAYDRQRLLESSSMKTGAELGGALKEAMTEKKVTQRELALEFGVKQSSVSEWTRHGRIAKKHLIHLVGYFSDTVGPEHWGLPPSWSSTAPQAEDRLEPLEVQALERYRLISSRLPKTGRRALVLLELLNDLAAAEPQDTETAIMSAGSAIAKVRFPEKALPEFVPQPTPAPAPKSRKKPSSARAQSSRHTDARRPRAQGGKSR